MIRFKHFKILYAIAMDATLRLIEKENNIQSMQLTGFHSKPLICLNAMHTFVLLLVLYQNTYFLAIMVRILYKATYIYTT